eukprot:11603943-Alexandrium_andersonii.AAC.1
MCIRDSFFCGVIWEVKDHSTFRIKGFKHKEQWMVQERGVIMEALWVTAMGRGQIPPGTFIA